MCCRGVHGIANAAYLSGFLFSDLLLVAPYCVPGGIRVVSGAGRWHSSDPHAIAIRNTRYGVVLPEPFRHRDDGVDGLVASFLAATASLSARSLPILCGPWVLECPLTFLHRTFWWRCVASRSLSHRSLFATGSLRWLSHLFSRHFLYQPLLMQLTR